MLPVVNMLWIGDRLGYVERLSMASFLEQGHPVHLHTYGRVEAVPAGVVQVEAGEIAPFETLASLRKSGSFALASDYFRLRLMQEERGLWSDSDMLCLRPVRIGREAVMGCETPTSINSAILYLDRRSPLIGDILSAFRRNRIPSWLRSGPRRRLWRQRLMFRSFGPQDMPWATYGPRAFTALGKKHGLSHLAEPVDVFYPLPVGRWHEVLEPGSSFDPFVTERSRTIHLWHSNHPGDMRPPSTSAIGRFGASIDA